MIYGCVECKRIWCNLEDYALLDKDNLNLSIKQDVSHGLCPECFSKRTDMIHKHQKNSGYDECYNNGDTCDNTGCGFKSFCGNKVLENWKSLVILLGK